MAKSYFQTMKHADRNHDQIKSALRSVLLPCSVFLLCAGCASRTASPSEAPHPPASTANWQMTLTAVPARPRQLDPTRFQVQLRDRSGKPVTGAQVSVQLAMPAMDMGRNEVTAQAGAAGVYTASGRFTMPGDWQVTVQTDKGAAHQSQSFPITVQ